MSTSLELAPNAVVGGDFRVIQPLSAGGMGVLYVAEQLSTGKKRALKVMHRRLVRDAKLRERFVQEARVGSLIDSDHVVEVIGAGVEESTGSPWIAMELLEGQDLGDFLADGQLLPVNEIVHLLRELCHALGAAHEAGVVHRDVKPENIFLSHRKSATVPWQVKVLDFGIAKILAQAKTSTTAVTGSPAWMAPEQTETHGEITPATDVWALGLLAFWLLTGRSYWRSTNDPDASVHALMREVMFEPLAPASARAAELDVGSRLPSGFDEWFGRTVQRDPTQRFADATRAFAALEQLLFEAGEDVEPPAPSRRPSFERISTRPLGTTADPATQAEPTALGSEHTATLSRGFPAARPEPHDGDGPPSRSTEVDAGPVVQRPRPTEAQAPAHLSATASAMVTGRPFEDDAPVVPLTRRWAQLLGVLAAAAVFGTALALSLRSAPDLAAGGASGAADERTPAVASSSSEPATIEPDRSAATRTAATERPSASARAHPPHRPPQPGTTPGRGRRPSRPAPEPPARAEPDSEQGPFASPPGPEPPARSESAPTAPPAAAEPALRPFDPAEARLAVQQQANLARYHCSNLPGPRVIEAEVVFLPAGTVERVALAEHEQRAGSTTGCVKTVLGYARVRPYLGGAERVSVLVPLR